jgi:hypothetical protein
LRKETDMAYSMKTALAALGSAVLLAGCAAGPYYDDYGYGYDRSGYGYGSDYYGPGYSTGYVAPSIGLGLTYVERDDHRRYRDDRRDWRNDRRDGWDGHYGRDHHDGRREWRRDYDSPG